MWFKNRRAKYRKTQRCSSPPSQQSQQQQPRENNPILSPPPPTLASPLISSSKQTPVKSHLLNRGASVDETLLLRSKLDHSMLTATSQYNNRPSTPGSEYTKSIWNPFVLRRADSNGGAVIRMGAGEKRHLISNLYPSSGATTLLSSSTPSLDLFRKYQQIGAGTTYSPFSFNTSPQPPPPPPSDLATKWHQHHPLVLNTPPVVDQHHMSSRRMFIS